MVFLLLGNKREVFASASFILCNMEYIQYAGRVSSVFSLCTLHMFAINPYNVRESTYKLLSQVAARTCPRRCFVC